MAKLNIKTCPSCEGTKIKKVRGSWTGNFKGQAYTVPNLEFFECLDCGEKIYDREAMREIEAHSPAFKRPKPKRKAARSARSATSLRT